MVEGDVCLLLQFLKGWWCCCYQELHLFHQWAHHMQYCVNLGCLWVLCQVSLGRHLLSPWVQMVVATIWICPMVCWLFLVGYFLCPVWHVNTQTLHLEGWRVWRLAGLVECHQSSCCTTGFAWCFCWDPLHPGITSGNHLVSSKEQLSLPIQCTQPLWWCLASVFYKAIKLCSVAWFQADCYLSWLVLYGPVVFLQLDVILPTRRCSYPFRYIGILLQEVSFCGGELICLAIDGSGAVCWLLDDWSHWFIHFFHFLLLNSLDGFLCFCMDCWHLDLGKINIFHLRVALCLELCSSYSLLLNRKLPSESFSLPL